MYRYGAKEARCTTHDQTGLNYYDPRENLLGFVVHLAGANKKPAGYTGQWTSCPSSFTYAYAKSEPNIDLPAELVGYKSGTSVKQLSNSKEGDYELFARALAGYNGGPKTINNSSWLKWLKGTPPSVVSSLDNKPGIRCGSCAYSLQIKNQKWGLPYRKYIWEGGKYPPFGINEDGTLKLDIEGEPIPHEKAGQKWCFVYGEEDWVNGLKYIDLNSAATRHANGNPKDSDMDTRTTCN
jgi:hypothetical protein